ncbi:MAG: flavin prenyltransferase UbiX [Geothermobacteraceae bacterium]
MIDIVVAITGASGTAYGMRLIQQLDAVDKSVAVLVTDAGRKVLGLETTLLLPGDALGAGEMLARALNLKKAPSVFALDDFMAPVASGTAAPKAMVVCPCSMGTLGRIAAGLSENLLERCADVVLKEGRKLVLVPRETPLNAIHLENMLRLNRAGAVILPAMPGFYRQPETVNDLVDFVVGKVLDQLGVEHKLFQRWGEEQDNG